MRHESAGVGGERPVPPSSDDMASSMVLLERMRGGEHAARDELIRRYWPRLERWARGRLPASARDLYETVDVVQETLIAALRRLEDPEADDIASLPAYLRTAVLNRIRTLAKRSRPRAEQIDLDNGPLDPGPSPLDLLIGRDAVERYERAFSRLGTEDREVVHLKVELGLPYDVITRELGKPSVTSTRMAVSRALYRLAREMGRHD